MSCNAKTRFFNDLPGETMALIDCPECGREVSSRAASCPECAYPVSAGTPAVPVRAVSQSVRVSALDVTKQIVGRVLFGGALMLSAAAYEAEAVAIAAVFVWGTSIPIWLKARRAEKLGAIGGGRALEEKVERRIGEMEERHYRQVAELEDQHTRQIADLEERVDFAERLLTKKREETRP